MSHRVIRRERSVILLLAILFVIGLAGVNAVWPAAFAVVIAIGGTAGALLVLFEVRLTKQIAQGEFIRDLQTSFAGDANISELWRKLLLGERIDHSDRALMSSYLTFFETLHLLQSKGALDLGLTDELFRNRFFTAVGHPGILEATLVRESGSFTNIHALIRDWHDYLLKRGKPIHAGYYAYVRAISEAKGFELTRLTTNDLAPLLTLQTEVLSELGGRDWLRENAEEMLRSCLEGGPEDEGHLALGAWYEGRLVAAAVLYDGGTGAESIKGYLTQDAEEMRRTLNLKLVLVSPEYRKMGLARTLIELLEREATTREARELLCTIHSANRPSRSLFDSLGYECVGKTESSYGKRLIYARELHSPDRNWAR